MHRSKKKLVESIISKIVKQIMMEAFWDEDEPMPSKDGPRTSVYNKREMGMGFDPGDKFKHKAYPDDYQIELLARTNKGWKVKQKERKGKKFIEKIAHYSDIDFDAKKGIWVPD